MQSLMLRPVLGMPVRIWLVALCAWAALSAAGLSVLAARAYGEQKAAFERRSDGLYALIRQRLDQNEAVLNGLEAAVAGAAPWQFERVRPYTRQIMARYPHIHSVGLQPRIERAVLERFERYAKQAIAPGYQITDSVFDAAGKPSFRRAAVRPFYYPVVFMEPPAPEASPVMGYDLYASKTVGRAIAASIASQHMEVSAPVNLYEGGRGYILLKAIFNTPNPASDLATRQGQATRTVSLLIRPSDFLDPAELAADHIALRLYHRAWRRDDPAGQVLDAGTTQAAYWWNRWLAPLTTARALPPGAQPFILETRQQPGADLLSPSASAVVLTTTLLLTLLSATLVHQRRRHADEARRAAEVLYRERERDHVTLRAIGDAVMRLDQAGRIEYLNPAAEQALGMQARLACGRQAADLLVLDYELATAPVEHPIALSLRARRSVAFPDNSVLVRADGQRMFIEGSVAPIFGSATDLVGAVAAWRDMGPTRARARERIAASEQRLRTHQAELAHVVRLNTMGEMATGIAHEINQPLAAILSYNQACVRMLQDDGDREDIIASMQAAAAQSQRAAAIIARLRAFVSKQAPQRKATDLNQVVQNALSLARHDLHDQCVDVELELAPELPAVLADSIQLEQVVLNLVRNALDAMGEAAAPAKRMVIATTAGAFGIALSVRDHGPGIAPAALASVFLPFFSTKPNGMGLGLAISHTIIDSFGGQLHAANAPDGGAIFHFTLPVAAVRESHPCSNPSFS